MKNILLVEDDNFLIDIYSKQFVAAGFKVQVATDGESAIGKIKEANPDLVLTDIILPKMSGWDMLKEIRETLGLKDLKIVILSALSQKEDFDKGENFGVVKYLPKTDYTPSQIVEEIKKIFS